MDVIRRHNIQISGQEHGQPILFAHGFGCDQNMWRFVAPNFETDFKVVLFDYVGAGGSDLGSYDPDRYSSLDGYAQDVVSICKDLDLREVILVGHSVSSMIGVLAIIEEPTFFERLVLVSPSPRYTNDGSYLGGFEEKDIEELLQSLESNYLGWSSAMAPVIMGNDDRPELGDELTSSFCRTDPEIARRFARATFLSDNREDLARVKTPSLVLQCKEDVIAPIEVGKYVARTLPNSTFVLLDATGHCPNLSAPEETSRAIMDWLRA